MSKIHVIHTYIFIWSYVNVIDWMKKKKIFEENFVHKKIKEKEKKLNLFTTHCSPLKVRPNLKLFVGLLTHLTCPTPFKCRAQNVDMVPQKLTPLRSVFLSRGPPAPLFRRLLSNPGTASLFMKKKNPTMLYSWWLWETQSWGFGNQSYFWCLILISYLSLLW